MSGHSWTLYSEKKKPSFGPADKGKNASFFIIKKEEGEERLPKGNQMSFYSPSHSKRIRDGEKDNHSGGERGGPFKREKFSRKRSRLSHSRHSPR